MVFHKAVEVAEASEDVRSRVGTLIDCVTFSAFNYISRGLFERDKLTFTAQLAFQVCTCLKAFAHSCACVCACGCMSAPRLIFTARFVSSC